MQVVSEILGLLRESKKLSKSIYNEAGRLPQSSIYLSSQDPIAVAAFTQPRSSQPCSLLNSQYTLYDVVDIVKLARRILAISSRGERQPLTSHRLNLLSKHPASLSRW